MSHSFKGQAGACEKAHKRLLGNCPVCAACTLADLADLGCETHYDCMYGLFTWKQTWSKRKKAWCCKHQKRGCEAGMVNTYDCAGGPASWKGTQRAWCCMKEGVACPEPPTAPIQRPVWTSPGVQANIPAAARERTDPAKTLPAAQAGAGQETMPPAARAGAGQVTASPAERAAVGQATKPAAARAAVGQATTLPKGGDAGHATSAPTAVPAASSLVPPQKVGILSMGTTVVLAVSAIAGCIGLLVAPCRRATGRVHVVEPGYMGVSANSRS